MRIGVIGAGFTGLSASYKLVKHGHDVVLFEKDSAPGGLAIGFEQKEWVWTLEKHYHHWFTSDSSVLRLARELRYPVIVKRPTTSVHVDGAIYQLDSPLHVLRFPQLPVRERLRMAAVLRSGFAHCSKELIFYTDSDNQFNIKDLDSLFPLLGACDIVSGYRLNRQDPLMRIFVAWVYNTLIRILFNLDVRDIDASFKLYKKDVFEKMKLMANTGLIDAEILIKAKKKGLKIGQIGVKHYPRTKGRTAYEMGKRNRIFAIVRPRVIIDVLLEIRKLWSDLR